MKHSLNTLIFSNDIQSSVYMTVLGCKPGDSSKILSMMAHLYSLFLYQIFFLFILLFSKTTAQMLVILQPLLPIAFVLALGYLCPQSPKLSHQGMGTALSWREQNLQSPVIIVSLNCLSEIGDELGGKTQAEVLLFLLDAQFPTEVQYSQHLQNHLSIVSGNFITTTSFI